MNWKTCLCTLRSHRCVSLYKPCRMVGLARLYFGSHQMALPVVVQGAPGRDSEGRALSRSGSKILICSNCLLHNLATGCTSHASRNESEAGVAKAASRQYPMRSGKEACCIMLWGKTVGRMARRQCFDLALSRGCGDRPYDHRHSTVVEALTRRS